MPVFWYPPPPPPPKYFLKKLAILQETLYTTHLLEVLDKMYKYEMDPTRTVGAMGVQWNLDFKVKFDLEGQGPLPPKMIGILTKLIFTSGPNLVILAWTGDDLSSRQAFHCYTHTDTCWDTQMQVMTIPWDQNWPQVYLISHYHHGISNQHQLFVQKLV